jgi:hypothetical protein
MTGRVGVLSPKRRSCGASAVPMAGRVQVPTRGSLTQLNARATPLTAIPSPRRPTTSILNLLLRLDAGSDPPWLAK